MTIETVLLSIIVDRRCWFVVEFCPLRDLSFFGPFIEFVILGVEILGSRVVLSSTTQSALLPPFALSSNMIWSRL